ncbi:MAG TPA: NAD(P)-dependent oxidoreductase [Acidobacteriota bacterium]|nr:NAD(P)-dependent oxidoreductase [Acidobacteriota bacterium]
MSRQFTPVVVTGGDGYLGSAVRAFFQADSASRRGGWDFLDPNQAHRFCRYQTVIHLAAETRKSPQAAGNCFQVNAQGAGFLAQHLDQGQTLIFASTKDIYHSQSDGEVSVSEACPTTYDRQNAYAWSKWLGEEYLRFYAAQRGFRLGIFRLSTIFAPPSAGNSGGWVSGFARCLREGNPLRLKGQGQQVRDILPAQELARAFQLFLRSDHPGGVFNIGGGLEFSGTLLEFAHRIAAAQGLDPSLIAGIDTPPGTDEQQRYVSDLGKIGCELGWTPEFDLDQALRQV